MNRKRFICRIQATNLQINKLISKILIIYAITEKGINVLGNIKNSMTIAPINFSFMRRFEKLYKMLLDVKSIYLLCLQLTTKLKVMNALYAAITIYSTTNEKEQLRFNYGRWRWQPLLA